jgi:tRNA-dihydrouridine synthase C
MLQQNKPALILAPMEGVTDAPMRTLQGEIGAFTYAVSEFLRVSQTVLSKSNLTRHVPELRSGSRTPTGLPVQVQLLGGHSGRLAASAALAVEAGAQAIDLNFGCPARTVNRHDGGATLLKYPKRIREIVSAVRAAVPRDVPVSAKLRLGWDVLDAIEENSEMAAEGGASWLTIHGRTRIAGYAPPVHWEPIGRVRERLTIPVIANGDIWTLADFRRCRDQTGCMHFMLGRGAMANPFLVHQLAAELGIADDQGDFEERRSIDWLSLLMRFNYWMQGFTPYSPRGTVRRMKQWLKMATTRGTFVDFDAIKRVENVVDLFSILEGRDGDSLSRHDLFAPSDHQHAAAIFGPLVNTIPHVA